jgi:ATP-dependent DNA helicase DinG
MTLANAAARRSPPTAAGGEAARLRCARAGGLAAAVADASIARETLIAEAGTGTGKTFAYLVPALLSASA